MIVAAFDFGMRFGYCIGEAGETPRVGAWDFSGRIRPQRWVSLSQKLYTLLRHPLAVVAYAERAPSIKSGVHQAHDWGGYRALVEMNAAIAGAKVASVYEQTARKKVLGTGRASKTTALVEMRRRFPDVKLAGFDEADAAVIWLWACGKAVSSETH